MTYCNVQRFTFSPCTFWSMKLSENLWENENQHHHHNHPNPPHRHTDQHCTFLIVSIYTWSIWEISLSDSRILRIDVERFTISLASDRDESLYMERTKEFLWWSQTISNSCSRWRNRCEDCTACDTTQRYECEKSSRRSSRSLATFDSSRERACTKSWSGTIHSIRT